MRQTACMSDDVVDDAESGCCAYPLTLHEGHLLIEVEGSRYLVDTGSPSSIGRAPVRLAGREFALQAADVMGHTCESLVEMVGTPFDGLIGTDILGPLDLEISLRDGVLRLCARLLEIEDGPVVESVQGVPLVTVEIAGAPVRMFFDTGAPLSYLSEDCVQECTALGEVEDFHPLLGRFRVPTFSVPVKAWGRSMTIRAGQMPTMLEMALALGGAEGILGTAVLEHGVFRWSQRQQRAALIPH